MSYATKVCINNNYPVGLMPVNFLCRFFTRRCYALLGTANHLTRTSLYFFVVDKSNPNEQFRKFARTIIFCVST